MSFRAGSANGSISPGHWLWAELIIADEPTSMLDGVSIRRSVLDLMRRMKETRSITFLYITHDIATAQFIADDIGHHVCGAGGRMGTAGTLVISNPQHPYTKLLLSAVPDPSETRWGGSKVPCQRGSGRAGRWREKLRPRLWKFQPGHFVRKFDAVS